MEELQRLVRTGEYLRATRYFEEVVRAAQLGTREIAACYHWASIAHYQLHNFYAARVCAQKAAELGEQAGDTLTVLKAWMNLIDIENVVGSPVEAISYGHKWLTRAALWQPQIDIKWSGRVHYNVALAYRHRKDYDAALKHLDLALPTLRQHDSVSSVIMCLQMAAWLRYEIGRIDEADAQYQDIESVLEFAQDDLEARIEQLLLKGWRAYCVEDFAEATRIAEELLHNPNLTDLQRFWNLWLLAGSAVKLHPHSTPELAKTLKVSAVVLAEVALDTATKAARSDLINRANVLRREANDLPDVETEAG